MHIDANTTAQAFERRKSFIARSLGKETGSKAHTCPAFINQGRTAGMLESWRCRFWLEGSVWNMAIYEKSVGKGLQQHNLLENGPVLFERVPAFSFRSCPDSLVPWEGEVWFRVLRSKFSPLRMLRQCEFRFCSVTAEKQLSILLESGQGQWRGLVLRLEQVY